MRVVASSALCKACLAIRQVGRIFFLGVFLVQECQNVKVAHTVNYGAWGCVEAANFQNCGMLGRVEADDIVNYSIFGAHLDCL